MERYSEYKDSGVQWLGEIPGHWGIMRSKYLLKIQANSTKRKCKIGLENIEGFTGKYLKTSSTFEGDGIDFDKGDIVYGKLRPYLCKVWLAEFDGNAVGDFYVYKTSQSYFNAYAKYLMLSNPFTDICNASTYGAKMPRVSHQFISSLNIPLPPLSEQHSIVSFLDDKCGKIDKMLEGKQKQIELLAEMKQRIIADAVTRGLNPDVKMKATNIPWLPEIPEHWELRKMKYLFRERSEKNHPAEPMLSATQTHGVILQSKYSGRVVVVNTGFEGLKLVKVGDFVIHLRSFQGGIELAHDQGIISSAYTVLSLNDSTQSDYFRYLFKSIPFIDLLKTCVTGIREGQNINYAKLKQNRIPLPPLDEQRAIVSYITDKTSKIDTLTSKLQQEIESIKEYKQRLISDVVTGQIKVC
jgi:type I restriction enzyme S subunit